MSENTIDETHEITEITKEFAEETEEKAKKKIPNMTEKVDEEKMEFPQDVAENIEMNLEDIKKEILSVIAEALEKAQKIKDEQKIKSLEELKEKINSAATREELVEFFNEAKKIIKIIEEEEELINRMNQIVDQLEPLMEKLTPAESKKVTEFLNSLELLMGRIKFASEEELKEIENEIRKLEKQVSEFMLRFKEKIEEKKEAEKTIFPPELSEFIAVMEGEKVPEEEKSRGLEEEIAKALEEVGVVKRTTRPRKMERVSLTIPKPPGSSELISAIKGAIYEAVRDILEEFTKLIRVEIRSLMRRLDQRFSEIQELIMNLQVPKEAIKKEEVVEKKQKIVANERILNLLNAIDTLINQVIPEDTFDLVGYAIRLEACKLQIDDLVKKIGAGEIKVNDEVIKQIEEKRAKLYERVSRVRELVEKIIGTAK